MPEHNEWSKRMSSMLGLEVKTTLSRDPEKAIVTGTLLSFSEDGEIVIRDEMGIVHWCWPNLDTELA